MGDGAETATPRPPRDPRHGARARRNANERPADRDRSPESGEAKRRRAKPQGLIEFMSTNVWAKVKQAVRLNEPANAQRVPVRR